MAKNKKATKGGINSIYMGILKDFEADKEKVLQEYVAKVKDIKKKGIKKIEAQMSKEDVKAAEKLLDEV